MLIEIFREIRFLIKPYLPGRRARDILLRRGVNQVHLTAIENKLRLLLLGLPTEQLNPERVLRPLFPILFQ